MSKFFKKRKVQAEIMEPDWQQKLKKGLAGEWEKLGKSGIETQAQDLLTKLMGSPLGLGMGTELETAGEEALIKTLTGGFDPYTSPEYESLRSGIEREGEFSRGRIARSARKGGMGFSTPRFLKEARLEDSMLGAKADVLAQLMGQERGRQTQAIPIALAQALGLAQFGEGQQLGRVGAGFGYGGLDRDIQRQILQGKTGVAGMKTPYGLKTMYGPSPFQTSMKMATDLIAAVKGGSPSGGAKEVSGQTFGGGGGYGSQTASSMFGGTGADKYRWIFGSGAGD